jgi:CheY-like chemotaxis protein
VVERSQGFVDVEIVANEQPDVKTIENLKGALSRIRAALLQNEQISYLFIVPEPFVGEEKLETILSKRFNQSTKGHIIVFLVTEVPNKQLGNTFPYEAFNLIRYHYPTIFVKISQGLIVRSLEDKHDLIKQSPSGTIVASLAELFPPSLRVRELADKEAMCWSQIKQLWEQLKKAMLGKQEEAQNLNQELLYYQELNEGFLGELSERRRLRESHGRKGLLPNNEVFEFFLRQDFARILTNYDAIKRLGDKHLIVIDDRPEIFKGVLECLENCFTNLHFYLYELDALEILIENLRTKQKDEIFQCLRQNVKPINGNCQKSNNLPNMESFDGIFLDLYFIQKEWTGWDMLEQLRTKLPEIPVFLLTKSQDIDDIRSAFNLQADGYIPKNRLIALPYYIYQFYRDNAGMFLEVMDKKYARCFLGYLRLWRRQQDLLWMNTKTPHMVDHTYQHTSNLWKLLNQLTEALGKDKLQEALVGSGSNTMVPFILATAIWLHDIGHKGHNEEVKAHAVRREHSLISGKHIVEQCDIYLPNLESWIGEQQIEKIKKDIACVCAYHTKKAAFSEKVEKALKKLDEESSHKYPQTSNRFTYLLEDESKNERGPIFLQEYLYNCTALLRLLDAIDNQSNRVGRNETERARVHNCYFEACYYLKEMARVISEMEEKLGSLRYEKEKSELFKRLKEFLRLLEEWLLPTRGHTFRSGEQNQENFFTQALRLIEKYVDEEYRKYDDHIKRIEQERNRLSKQLEALFSEDFYKDWDYVSEHLVYLLLQPRHYIKHGTFKEVRIERSWRQDASRHIRVVYTFETPKADEKGNEHAKRQFRQALDVFINLMEEYYLVQDHLDWLGLEEIVFESETPRERREEFFFPVLEQSNVQFFVRWGLNDAINHVAEEARKQALLRLKEEIMSRASIKKKCLVIKSFCGEEWTIELRCFREDNLWEVLVATSDAWSFVWRKKGGLHDRTLEPEALKKLLERFGLAGLTAILGQHQKNQAIECQIFEGCVSEIFIEAAQTSDPFRTVAECVNLYADVVDNKVWLWISPLQGGKRRMEALVDQWCKNLQEGEMKGGR